MKMAFISAKKPTAQQIETAQKAGHELVHIGNYGAFNVPLDWVIRRGDFDAICVDKRARASWITGHYKCCFFKKGNSHIEFFRQEYYSEGRWQRRKIALAAKKAAIDYLGKPDQEWEDVADVFNLRYGSDVVIAVPSSTKDGYKVSVALVKDNELMRDCVITLGSLEQIDTINQYVEQTLWLYKEQKNAPLK